MIVGRGYMLKIGDKVIYTFREMGMEQGHLYPEMQIGSDYGTIVKVSIFLGRYLIEKPNWERIWVDEEHVRLDS